MAHIFEVPLIKIAALLRKEEVDQFFVPFQPLSTHMKQSLGFLTLMREHLVHRVFVQAVYELNKVLLEKMELLCNSYFECLERLTHEHLFTILRC